MWTPAERIKHDLLAARWPSKAEAENSHLYRPIRVGPVELRERSWVPAMVPWRASDDGVATDAVLDWYERFARGRPGAIVVEATGIRDIPSGPLLRIGDDRFIARLRELTRRVREASRGETRLFIQLIDFLTIRRRPSLDKYFARFLQVTPRHAELLEGRAQGEAAIRRLLPELPRAELERILSARELEALDYGYRERVTDLELEHIRNLPRALPGLFAAAAARAQQAGFDGVELHCAHAYTLASFLSRTNTRDDGYGGSLEARARLPLEVYRAVRAGVSSGFAVGARFLADECIAGGSDADDASYFAVEFARAGMDFLSLSRGGKFDDAKQPKQGEAAYPYTGRSGYECMPTVRSDARGPFGRNLPSAQQVRRALKGAGLSTPLVVAGGIATFEQAESILRDDIADIVGSARQSLADPDWFLKTRLGRGGEVRRCEFTNYCEGLDQKHKQVTCKLWDRQDLAQAGTRVSWDGRRRLLAPDWLG